MTQVRLLRALALLALAGVAAIWFWRQHNQLTPVTPQPSATIPVDERVKAPVIASPEQPAATRRVPSPVVHRDTLALRQALAEFPKSFEAAAASDDQDLALQLLTTKMVEAISPFSQAAFAPLHDLMMAHDFLWHDQDLVFMDWGGCLQLGCDQATFTAQVQRLAVDAAHGKATLACLASWKQLLPLALHASSANVQTLQLAKPQVEACLQAASAAGVVLESTVLSQAQYYLGFIKRVSGDAAANDEHSALSLAAPQLPPMATLLPER